MEFSSSEDLIARFWSIVWVVLFVLLFLWTGFTFLVVLRKKYFRAWFVSSFVLSSCFVFAFYANARSTVV